MPRQIDSATPVTLPARAFRALALVAATGGLLLPAVAIAQQADLARRAFAPSAMAVVEAPSGPALVAGGVPQAPQRDRSRSGRILLQFLASSAGAAGTGLAAYFVFEDVGTRRVKGDEGYTRAGNVAYLTGSFTGATLGAHLVGRGMGGRSPLWATAAGAFVGTLPLLVAAGVDEPYLPLMGIALGWIPQGAFATIGFDAADRRSR